jgi:hypothetical protein
VAPVRSGLQAQHPAREQPAPALQQADLWGQPEAVRVERPQPAESGACG